MNDCCADYPHRRYTLTQDEPNLGSMRDSEAVTFSKGDQVVVELGSVPSTGKIVMIDSKGIRGFVGMKLSMGISIYGRRL
jgi:hypothetical protein